jgi:putative (di)nucleoside polyphosphate hydrolase
MAIEPGIDYIDRDGFRANVGIVLTQGDAVFLGGRVGGRGWQFPQGGISRGESVEAALFRELREEIGLEPSDVEVLGSTRGWLRYRLPRHYVRDHCIGQKQRWFLLRLTAPESRLRFDTTAEPEFDRWRWADFWAPVQEVVYFKRRVYIRALHELGEVLFPDGLPPYPAWWAGIGKEPRTASRSRGSQSRSAAPKAVR